MWFKASAPGSLMLLGEYAVLEQGYALVVAVDRRMTVELRPRDDNKVKLFSQLGNLETELSQLEVRAPFQFVLFTLKKYKERLPSGCDIIINSEFSDQLGFGSSSAVTVALVTVLHQWFNHPLSQEEIIREARSIVRSVQGLGSGADVAASVLGGVVAYRAEPLWSEVLSYHYPLTAIYSGAKTKTADAITQVKKYFANQPEAFQKILFEINQCAEHGIAAARLNDHVTLGQVMNEQQKWMEALNVNTLGLEKCVEQLRKSPHVLGAKISGSGLGDCAIGLGEYEMNLAQLDSIEQKNIFPIKIALQGVYCEQG